MLGQSSVESRSTIHFVGLPSLIPRGHACSKFTSVCVRVCAYVHARTCMCEHLFLGGPRQWLIDLSSSPPHCCTLPSPPWQPFPFLQHHTGWNYRWSNCLTFHIVNSCGTKTKQKKIPSLYHLLHNNHYDHYGVCSKKNRGFDLFYELIVFLLYRDNMPTNSFTSWESVGCVCDFFLFFLWLRSMVSFPVLNSSNEIIYICQASKALGTEVQ